MPITSVPVNVADGPHFRQYIGRCLTPPPASLDSTLSMNKSLGITLLGCGVVGGGVANILTEQRELLRARTGLAFELKHVVDKDPAMASRFPNLPLTADAAAAITDPQVEVVVETIGGT